MKNSTGIRKSNSARVGGSIGAVPQAFAICSIGAGKGPGGDLRDARQQRAPIELRAFG